MRKIKKKKSKVRLFEPTKKELMEARHALRVAMSELCPDLVQFEMDLVARSKPIMAIMFFRFEDGEPVEITHAAKDVINGAKLKVDNVAEAFKNAIQRHKEKATKPA